MGSLYTQHFGMANASQRLRTSFDLTYSGSLASTNTTKPLFAAMVKGLLAPITSTADTHINIVNAELVAKERGILINEARSRDSLDKEGYSASVTLRARLAPRSPSASRSRTDAGLSTGSTRNSGRAKQRPVDDQVITGFVANNTPYISRLGRFTTSFVPEGTLLICRNFDEPGTSPAWIFCHGE